MTEVLTPVPARVRVRDTFLAPGRLSGDLAGSVPWLGVLLVSTAVAILAVLTVPDEVFLEPMRNAVNRRGVPVDVTSPPDVIATWGRAMGMLATLATHPVIAFVLAGFLTGVFTILGRGRGTFLEYLSLSSHGLLIPALGTILTLTVRFLANIGGQGDIVFRVAQARGSGDGFATALLAIDPFVIWMLIVVGIGASQFDRRRGAVAVSGVLIVAYLAFVLIAEATIGVGTTPPSL